MIHPADVFLSTGTPEKTIEPYILLQNKRKTYAKCYLCKLLSHKGGAGLFYIFVQLVNLLFKCSTLLCSTTTMIFGWQVRKFTWRVLRARGSMISNVRRSRTSSMAATLATVIIPFTHSATEENIYSVLNPIYASSSPGQSNLIFDTAQCRICKYLQAHRNLYSRMM